MDRYEEIAKYYSYDIVDGVSKLYKNHRLCETRKGSYIISTKKLKCKMLPKNIFYMLFNKCDLPGIGFKIFCKDGNEDNLTPDNLVPVRVFIDVDKTYESLSKYVTYDEKGHVYVDGKRIGYYDTNKKRNFFKGRVISVRVDSTVWMLHNKQDIPVGKEVRHKNGDNTDDSPDNLFLATLEVKQQYIIAAYRWSLQNILPDDYEVIFRDGDYTNHDYCNYQMVLRGTSYLYDNSGVTGVFREKDKWRTEVFGKNLGNYSTREEARETVCNYIIKNIPIRRND
jgi:hypothetical protein